MGLSVIKPRKTDNVEIAQADAPQLPEVTWWSDPGLRKLYFYAAILCVASATTGYDGSMLNAMQFFPTCEYTRGSRSAEGPGQRESADEV